MSFISRVQQTRQKTLEKSALELGRVKNFTVSNIGMSNADTKEYSDRERSSTDKAFEFLLTTRYIQQKDLESNVEDFKCYSISKLLATVYPPSFTPPADPQYLVYGIVARRGEVRQTQSGKKYVSLLLCDLQYEVNLTIHGAAFDKYYKIRPGTLIAVCNPGLYVAKQQTSALALSISCQGSPLLEIGRAQDLGQCSAEATTTRKRCKNWVNLIHTEVCEYHQEIRANKAMAQRPEFNSVVTRLFNPKHNKRKLAVYRGGEVKWRQGLQLDYQAPNQPIFQSGPFKEEPDHDRVVQNPGTKKKVQQRRTERLKAEVRMRKLLAQRSDGHMLREYEKGALVNPELYEAGSKKLRVFAPEHLKRIGFDPTMMRHPKALTKESKPKATESALDDGGGEVYGEDSDLEII